MKRKTKKRIELLELAIKAAEKRIDDVGGCLDAATCLLCMNIPEVFKGCDECPADESYYSCDNYGKDIDKIQRMIKLQIIFWRNEIEKLKGNK